MSNITDLPSTNRNTISDNDSDEVWNMLCHRFQNAGLDGKAVHSSCRFNDSRGSGDQVVASDLNYDDVSKFTLRFYRYDNRTL